MAVVKLNPQTVPGIKKMIGVLSGKGGSGKTFVATNLALMLAKQGYRVGLFDADLSSSDTFHMMGITTRLTPSKDNKLSPAEKYGVKVMAMAGLCGKPDEPVMWRGPISSKITQQLIRETIWGELDLLIIDFPTGTPDHAISILQQFLLDGIVMVTQPQQLAALDTQRAINMVTMLDIPIMGLVENMRGEIFGEGGARQLTERNNLTLLGSIPLRKSIATMCDKGTAAVFNSDELQMIFTKIARSLVETFVVE
ncbi:hypothetical protein CO046_04185 [Candidatus Peregrinibacteria bacterium CG_4_9_14_0_2_um_filter_53_11]|nr:MAG: hypothetical protein CO046_04185 [Candidatus Peregrinibacteria bacterium CG_4_9_14_0_2_um_filter_53_11]